MVDADTFTWASVVGGSLLRVLAGAVSLTWLWRTRANVEIAAPAHEPRHSRRLELVDPDREPVIPLQVVQDIWRAAPLNGATGGS